MLREIRCVHCDRKLGELNGALKIICRKCGKENYITTDNTRIADQASQGE